MCVVFTSKRPLGKDLDHSQNVLFGPMLVEITMSFKLCEVDLAGFLGVLRAAFDRFTARLMRAFENGLLAVHRGCSSLTAAREEDQTAVYDTLDGSRVASGRQQHNNKGEAQAIYRYHRGPVKPAHLSSRRRGTEVPRRAREGGGDGGTC